MASSSVILKLACVVLTCMVVCSHYAEAAISCGLVVSKLTPCVPYLRGGVPAPPPDCCGGVKGLNSQANTTPDRQAACVCLKKAATSIPGIKPPLASSLPGKCGVSIPYAISPSTDCTKVK